MLEVSLREVPYRSCHDGLGMIFFPSVRQEPNQIFLRGFVEVWHRGDHGVEVKARVDIMVAACCEQRLDDAHVFSGLMVAAEHVVLSPERDGPDLVLGKVVVKQQPSVIEDTHHLVPAGVGIGDGLACQRAFAVSRPFGLHPFLHFLHYGP